VVADLERLLTGNRIFKQRNVDIWRGHAENRHGNGFFPA